MLLPKLGYLENDDSPQTSGRQIAPRIHHRHGHVRAAPQAVVLDPRPQQELIGGGVDDQEQLRRQFGGGGFDGGGCPVVGAGRDLAGMPVTGAAVGQLGAGPQDEIQVLRAGREVEEFFVTPDGQVDLGVVFTGRARHQSTSSARIWHARS
jgi:hypothetical protein